MEERSKGIEKKNPQKALEKALFNINFNVKKLVKEG